MISIINILFVFNDSFSFRIVLNEILLIKCCLKIIYLGCRQANVSFLHLVNDFVFTVMSPLEKS